VCAYRHARLQKNPSTQTAPVLSVRAQWSPSGKVSTLHSFTCSSACTLFSSSQQVRGLPRHDSLHDPMGVLAPLSCAIAFSSLSTTCIPQQLPSTPQWYSPSCAQTNSTEQSHHTCTSTSDGAVKPAADADASQALRQGRNQTHQQKHGHRNHIHGEWGRLFDSDDEDGTVGCLQPRRVCGLWLSWTRSRQVHW